MKIKLVRRKDGFNYFPSKSMDSDLIENIKYSDEYKRILIGMQ